jgi:hypothetical protein
LSLVDIIILNYFRENLTIKCIKSLIKQSFTNFRIIIVDNGSIDQEHFQNSLGDIPLNINYFKSKKNLGFAKGVNFGLKKSSAKYAILLNNDTIVSKYFIEKIFNSIESNDNCLAVSPWISDGEKIWFAYADIKYFWTHFTNHSLKHNGIKKKSYINCSYLPLTAVICNRILLEKLGNLSEKYFLYYEDAILGLTAKKHRLKMLSYPEILVDHKSSSSTESGIKQFYLYRSRFIFLFDAFFDFYLPLAISTFIRNAFKEILTDALKFDRKTTYYRVKGILSNF